MNYEGDINYIKQLTAFFDLLQCNQLNTSAHVLYHVLLMINNKCGWLEWFQRTNQSLCGFAGINEKTLVTSRNILKQRGLIDFAPGKKRGEITKYKVIKLYDETVAEVTKEEKRTVQNEPKVTPYFTPKVSPQSNTKPTDISKLNKNKKENDRYCNDHPENKFMGSIGNTVEKGVIKTVQSSAVNFYKKNIAKGNISDGLRDDILSAVRQYGDDLVLAALERTMSMANRPNWKYAQKILLSSTQNYSRPNISETYTSESNTSRTDICRANISMTNHSRTNDSRVNDSGSNMIKRNKFMNFPQTKYNFDEIERIVLEDQIRRYEKQKAAGEIT
jgi:DnaD/phage-associated family protein